MIAASLESEFPPSIRENEALVRKHNNAIAELDDSLFKHLKVTNKRSPVLSKLENDPARDSGEN
ncbi:hypothetical protein BFJ63_vAg19968 [Fusarium oxysporum f. sp. narcissi]|uniref:Uncharacterized protein n=1 Tax=Fusarium oxysporum f. sp. narcissi TaxID=451672 RepID=A0A4Q2UY31_FUSOX|nr:hypothetical protein H9L39_20029 [Fusarium oxysporum f. sp. albedinis]RYC77158.1 hypothetical protein BFJ63_vAg19968 [Fusarium oxysporum f. sp. narcissi]